jgi:hypothetical protein
LLWRHPEVEFQTAAEELHTSAAFPVWRQIHPDKLGGLQKRGASCLVLLVLVCHFHQDNEKGRKLHHSSNISGHDEVPSD